MLGRLGRYALGNVEATGAPNAIPYPRDRLGRRDIPDGVIDEARTDCSRNKEWSQVSPRARRAARIDHELTSKISSRGIGGG
jgi:hypothetical protein